MIPDGQGKRNPGNICAQLLLSASVLLVPPLLMVAGVMYLGSPKVPGKKLEQSALTREPNSPRALRS